MVTAHVVSDPLASSPLLLVVPLAHAVHTWDDTYSFSAHTDARIMFVTFKTNVDEFEGFVLQSSSSSAGRVRFKSDPDPFAIVTTNCAGSVKFVSAGKYASLNLLLVSIFNLQMRARLGAEMEINSPLFLTWKGERASCNKGSDIRCNAALLIKKVSVVCESPASKSDSNDASTSFALLRT